MRRHCLMAVGILVAAVANSQEVWQPKTPPAGTPEKPENVRIVKFGAAWNRFKDDGELKHRITRYQQVKDPLTGKYQRRLQSDNMKVFQDFDVDGDGRMDDDSVICFPFDLSEDNPLTPHAPYFDETMGTQRMYGGITSYEANNLKPGFTELGVNDINTGGAMQPARNWVLHHDVYRRFSPFRIYLLYLWQKFDFNNGGDKYRVSFDEKSELRHQPNRYFMGIEGLRWVVRNGEQFYVSEYVFEGQGLHTYNPVRSRWAKYYPTAPYKIDFDPATAKFEEVKFDNVTTVGLLVYKNTLSPGYFGHKWYAFECDAVVHRPAQPSQNIDMAELKGAAAPFYLSTCEVPYLLWRKVHRFARYNAFAGPRGFSFRLYGDMGSMAFPNSKGEYGTHGQNEPVTSITYGDALAWCNALSQQESKLPCYYVDPEFKTPFRDVIKWPLYFEKFKKTPTIYVNWAANGYRLPTQEEWLTAWKAGGFKASAIAKGTGTRAVGGLKGANGLYDMAGNIWEMVWNHGDSLDLSTFNQFTVMGGDFRHPGKPEATSASAYGDKPFLGHPCIGFRMVRRESGLPAPRADVVAAGEVPVWNITKDLTTAADASRQFKIPLATNYLDIVPVAVVGHGVGKYEVTYGKWKPVYDWAVANGYEFDCTGEMGSMAYWGFGPDWKPGEHGPDEPVAGMTQYDAVIWLNALSQLEGRKPVTYADKGLTQIFKKSYVYRPPQLFWTEGSGSHIKKLQASKSPKEDNPYNTLYWPRPYNEITSATPATEQLYAGDDAYGGDFPAFLEDPSANGYRLPTREESLKFTGSILVSEEKIPENLAAHAWLLDESGLRTHPVGQKQPNEFGLYDVVGNVNELGDNSTTEAFLKSGYLVAPLVRRMGGGFFDLPHGLAPSLERDNVQRVHGRALPYPDTGFRPLQQKPQ